MCVHLMRLSFRAVLLCISMRLLQARTLTVQYTFVNGDTLRASSEADWRVRYRGERGAGRRPDTRSRRDSGATKSSSTAMSIPLRLRASGAPRRQTASRALRGACGVPWKAVFTGVVCCTCCGKLKIRLCPHTTTPVYFLPLSMPFSTRKPQT